MHGCLLFVGGRGEHRRVGGCRFGLRALTGVLLGRGLHSSGRLRRSGGGFLGLDPTAYGLRDGGLGLGTLGGLGLRLAQRVGEGQLGLLGQRRQLDGALLGIGEGPLCRGGSLALLPGGVLGGDALGQRVLGRTGVVVGRLLGCLLLLVGLGGEFGEPDGGLLGLFAGGSLTGGIGQCLGGGCGVGPGRFLGRVPELDQIFGACLELGDPRLVGDGSCLGIREGELGLLDPDGVLGC